MIWFKGSRDTKTYVCGKDSIPLKIVKNEKQFFKS